MKGLSRPDYEWRFIGSERLCAMKMGRIQKPTHEHAMWGKDRYTRVQENDSWDVSWRQRCHTDLIVDVSELNHWPNSWG